MDLYVLHMLDIFIGICMSASVDIGVNEIDFDKNHVKLSVFDE